MDLHLSERAEKLERAVTRWRLAAIALGILLLCSLACGGTFATVLLMKQADQRAQEADARMQAEEARQRAEEALW